MTQVSRYKLSPDMLDKLFTMFFHTIGKRGNRREFESIVNGLFTKTEKIVITKRIAVIYLLIKQIKSDDICKTIKASKSTVSKYSILLHNKTGLVLFLEKFIRNEKIGGFFEDLIIELFQPPAGGSWRAALKAKYEKRIRKERGI